MMIYRKNRLTNAPTDCLIKIPRRKAIVLHGLDTYMVQQVPQTQRVPNNSNTVRTGGVLTDKELVRNVGQCELLFGRTQTTVQSKLKDC